MNCKQAKQIKIEDFLKNQGITPAKIYRNFFWYKAPYRKDSNPSFKVNTTKNVWYDMTTGTGGNIIDLTLLMYNTDLTGALRILEKPGLSSPSFSFSDTQKTNFPGIEIKHIQTLQNRALIQFLNKREISQSLAASFIQECYYYAFPGQTKAFFAICWQNIKGGYNLQNAFGNKYIAGATGVTLIEGTDKTANIFEGMLDFLSALEYFKIQKPESTIIILNSITNLGSVKDKLKEYSHINLFLDNDIPGEKTATEIKLIHSGVKDYSKITYPGYNDFNDFICKKPQT
ncbi:Toprim-like [Mariniphaga anaerophila]|uniref:Toprim-like n=1 Tax=Mariniphaga anaerophila TaxID=1484053 RepID=A0A1M5CEQ8_9BACT|nr:toprim domain-containing protein [Mariniphaga anaerophila]SHF53233.1 Toprim-like [Mariniphaga anaerophila]